MDEHGQRRDNIPVRHIAPLRFRRVGRRATLPAMRSPHHSRDDQIHTHSSRMAAMDTLARLLETPRARDAFALRVVMSSPWSLRILAESPLALLVGVKGETW